MKTNATNTLPYIGDTVRHAQYGIGVVNAIKPTTDTPRGYVYKVKFGANIYEMKLNQIALVKRTDANAALLRGDAR